MSENLVHVTSFVKNHIVKEIYYAHVGDTNYLIIEFDSDQSENPCLKIPVYPDAEGNLGTPFLEAFPIGINYIEAN